MGVYCCGDAVRSPVYFGWITVVGTTSTCIDSSEAIFAYFTAVVLFRLRKIFASKNSVHSVPFERSMRIMNFTSLGVCKFKLYSLIKL